MRTTVIIEKGNDGSYGAYLPNNDLPFGIIGDGKTTKEAKEDFLNSYQEMKEYYSQKQKTFVEAEFEFQYDIASFLNYYARFISLAGLERLTGVNQGQLSHYVTGRRKPSPKTTQKIKEKLNQFGQELAQLDFI